MNCIHFESVCLRALLSSRFINRSQTHCFSSFHNSIQNNKSSSFDNKNIRNVNLKQNWETYNDSQSLKRKGHINLSNFNRNRKEENISFDSKFGDTFGTLSDGDKSWSKYKRLSAEDLPDDDDGYDKLEIKRGPKMSPIGYSKLLTELIHKKPIQVKKALELYNRMISEDRVPPDKCTYTVLISGCAKVGYTEKAFELFEELLKNEFRPSRHAITALFNACAECPFPEYGLEKARYLREWLNLEGIVVNTFHYHAMIKAFGKLGDMKTAFQIVDEMVSNGQSTTTETFAMLLMGCISDKDSGLYHAIRIIRKMKFHNMPLDIYTFNLLLRAIRDCGIGAEDNIRLLMQDWSYKPKDIPLKRRSKNANLKNSPTLENWSSLDSENSETSEINRNTCVAQKSLVSSSENSLVIKNPNLLYANQSSSGQVVAIKYESLSSPLNRFLLFGGIEGYLEMMNECNVKPNINTLTLMLELIDLNEDSKQQILNALEKFNVKADTDFFNILLKKVCCKNSVKDAKDILLMMQKRGLQCNIITFGVLSLGCNSLVLGKQLLSDMEASGFKANVEIIGGLLISACKKNDFWYINYLIDYMKKNEINPNQMAIEKMEIIKIKFQKMLTDYDRNKLEHIPDRYLSDSFRKGFATFKANYEQWIQNVIVSEPQHPWDQFKFEGIKNKKGMHNFVKFMKKKIEQTRGKTSVEDELDYYEEEELYNE